MTESSARDGLARAVISDIRSQSGPGPVRVAVLAAERIMPVEDATDLDAASGGGAGDAAPPGDEQSPR
jgi:hypothetical protein